MSNIEFPNGFTSWYETMIEIAWLWDYEHTKFYDQNGTGGVYEKIREWTDEFEELHRGREWDGDFFEEIESFVVKKNSELEDVMPLIYDCVIRWKDDGTEVGPVLISVGPYEGRLDSELFYSCDTLDEFHSLNKNEGTEFLVLTFKQINVV